VSSVRSFETLTAIKKRWGKWAEKKEKLKRRKKKKR